jgi:glucose dehydrogenase (acceptor)
LIGPLTAPNGIIGQAFLSSKKVQREGIDWPDLQLYFTPVGIYEAMDKQFSRAAKTKPRLISALINPYMGRDSVLASVALVRPKSVGKILLRNKNPMTPPLIDPNYLNHPDDLEVLVEGVKTTVKLLEDTSPFKQFNSTISQVHLPGCEAFTFKSNKYWECVVRTLLTTVWHPVGTCRMGHASDPRSVVDSKLRVLNTHSLRIIDASIMSNIVNGNTNSPTIMIAEKGADFIREYWTNQMAVCDLKDFYFNTTPLKLCFYTKLF